jgi:hypothetical protein
MTDLEQCLFISDSDNDSESCEADYKLFDTSANVGDNEEDRRSFMTDFEWNVIMLRTEGFLIVDKGPIFQ